MTKTSDAKLRRLGERVVDALLEDEEGRRWMEDFVKDGVEVRPGGKVTLALWRKRPKMSARLMLLVAKALGRRDAN